MILVQFFPALIFMFVGRANHGDDAGKIERGGSRIEERRVRRQKADFFQVVLQLARSVL